MKLNTISEASTISEAIRKFFATCGDLIDGGFGALMIAGVLAIALVFTAVFPVREAQDKPTPALHFTEQAWKTTSSDNQQGWKIYAAPTPALAQKASTLNVYNQTQTSGNQGLQTLAQKASDAFTYDQTCSQHCPDGVAGSLDLVGHHWWQIYPAGSMTLQFSGPDGMTMAINADTGQVMFGEGVTPDEATKLFIKAMHEQWPRFCPSYAAESKEEVK